MVQTWRNPTKKAQQKLSMCSATHVKLNYLNTEKAAKVHWLNASKSVSAKTTQIRQAFVLAVEFSSLEILWFVAHLHLK